MNQDNATPTNSNDPLLKSNLRAGITFDLNIGINYNFKGLNIGFSIPQLLQTKVLGLNSNSTLDYRFERHYLAMATYEISISNDKFFIEPGAMFRFTEEGEFQIDGLAKFSYKRIVWASIAYRYDYAITIGAGLQLHDRFSLGYATDISVNGLQGYASGTHEISLCFKIGKRDNTGLIENIKSKKNSAL